MSDAWKALERTVAETLGGKRVHRANDFGVSDVDVKIEDFPHWKIDAKLRKRGWKHHAMLREVAKKYCRDVGDMALLVTKNGGEHGAVVSLSLRDFGILTATLRALRPDPNELARLVVVEDEVANG